MPDERVASERIQIERKTFFIDYMQNDKGDFLRITENVGGHRSRIIIPAPGIDDFIQAIDNVLDQAGVEVIDPEDEEEEGEPESALAEG